MQSFIFTRDTFYTMINYHLEGGFYHINYYRLFVINFEENCIFKFYYYVCNMLRNKIKNFNKLWRRTIFATSSLTFCIKFKTVKWYSSIDAFFGHKMKSLKVFLKFLTKIGLFLTAFLFNNTILLEIGAKV